MHLDASGARAGSRVTCTISETIVYSYTILYYTRIHVCRCVVLVFEYYVCNRYIVSIVSRRRRAGEGRDRRTSAGCGCGARLLPPIVGPQARSPAGSACRSRAAQRSRSGCPCSRASCRSRRSARPPSDTQRSATAPPPPRAPRAHRQRALTADWCREGRGPNQGNAAAQHAAAPGFPPPRRSARASQPVSQAHAAAVA